MQRLIVVLFSIIAVLGVAKPSTAMEIREVSSSDIGCTVLVSGEITEGASEQLRNWFIDRAPAGSGLYQEGPLSTWQERVCFDSVGGSFIEGIALAQLLSNSSTGVDAGHHCLSACFVAFMAGTFDRQEDREIVSDRVMHPSAVLGYHRPGIPFDDRDDYTTEEIELAWDLSMQAVSGILELLDRSVYGLDSTRLREMLTVPFSDMAFIRTVGEALAFGITVAPLRLPDASEVLASGFARMCRTIEITDYQGMDRGPTDQRYDVTEYGELSYQANFPYSDEGYACSAVLYSEEKLALIIERENTRDAPAVSLRNWMIGEMRMEAWWFSRGDIPISAMMFYPPYQQISALQPLPPASASRENAAILNQIVARSVETPAPQSTQACTLASPRATVANVNEFVNIRSDPSLRASIVARAWLGERLTLTDPNQWWFMDTARGQQCSRLCEQVPQNPTLRPRLLQCIEAAETWHQVRNGLGKTGLVSVYFLDGAQ